MKEITKGLYSKNVIKTKEATQHGKTYSRLSSEIGKLKTVLLKRPGQEVENLTPDIMNRLVVR